MIIPDEKANPPYAQGSRDGSNVASEDNPESFGPPPPDYNTIQADTDHSASYAPDRKDDRSREIVLAPPPPGEIEAQEAQAALAYQASRSGPSGYAAGPPPDQYHQYGAPVGKYEPPPGPPMQGQNQYAAGPGPSGPPINNQPQYPAYSPPPGPPMGVAGPSSGPYIGTPSQQPRMDRPPPSFSRPPPPGLPYTPFPPTYLIALGGNLVNGFPLIPPPSPIAPHPFATHDVSESDWTRLLGDLQRIGAIPPPQPTAIMGRQGPLSGIVNALRHGDPSAKTRECVDAWNAQFFHPRRMEAILAAGPTRIDSGTGPVPPLDPRLEPSNFGGSSGSGRSGGSRRSNSHSSSSSDSDGPSTGNRRADRRARKELRKEQRRERRRAKKQGGSGGLRSGGPPGNGGNGAPYRLFLVGF